LASRWATRAWRGADLPHRTIAELGTAPPAQNAFAPSVGPKRDAVEPVGAVGAIHTQSILPASGSRSIVRKLANRSGATAHAVEASLCRYGVRIERTSAFVETISVDIVATWCKARAVELGLARSVHAHAESSRGDRVAEVALGAVYIEEAGNPPVDTCALFAGESEHAVEARATPGRRLHASLALARYQDAFAFRDAVPVAVARASGCKRALTNRNSVVAVAARLDADVPDAAVLVAIAEELVGAPAAKGARLTGRNRDGATAAPEAA
jgi:hypothetical protein